jgi:hypothetical protein
MNVLLVSLVLSYVLCFAKYNFDAIFCIYGIHTEKNVFRILRKYENRNIPPFEGPYESLLPQLPQKTMLDLKSVKID